MGNSAVPALIMVNYGLGSENENLPGFVVLITGNVPEQVVPRGKDSAQCLSGVEFRSAGDPVLFFSNPRALSRSRKRTGRYRQCHEPRPIG